MKVSCTAGPSCVTSNGLVGFDGAMNTLITFGQSIDIPSMTFLKDFMYIVHGPYHDLSLSRTFYYEDDLFLL